MESFVYVYWREDGSPYYVGKGVGNRHKKEHTVTVPPDDRITFPVINTTNEWAMFMEMELISKWGRLSDGTGCLENSSDGGSNNFGFQRGVPKTQEHREAMRVPKTFGDPEGLSRDRSRRQMGSQNTFFGKTHSDEKRKEISLKTKEAMSELPKRTGGKWGHKPDGTKHYFMDGVIPEGWKRGMGPR